MFPVASQVSLRGQRPRSKEKARYLRDKIPVHGDGGLRSQGSLRGLVEHFWGLSAPLRPLIILEKAEYQTVWGPFRARLRPVMGPLGATCLRACLP